MLRQIAPPVGLDQRPRSKMALGQNANSKF
jgi:hypothetical protein